MFLDKVSSILFFVVFAVTLFSVLVFSVSASSNKVTNTGFEYSSEGWELDSDYIRTSESAHFGSYSIKQNSVGSWQNFLSRTFDVIPDTDYVFSFYLKTTSLSGYYPNVQINAGGPWGSNIVSDTIPDTLGLWQFYSLDFNSGSNTSVAFRLFNNNGDATVYYDDFSLLESDIHLAVIETEFTGISQVYNLTDYGWNLINTLYQTLVFIFSSLLFLTSYSIGKSLVRR